MNQVKKQRSTVTESFNTKTKKFRRAAHNETNSITCFENFSNEICYEIFEYLNGYDIYQSFQNLNTRFQRLITSPLLLLNISLNDHSQLDIKQYCRQVIIPNKHRIRSLRIRDARLVEGFFAHCTIDSSFDRLESIALYKVSAHKLMKILVYLQSLPHLYALTIEFIVSSKILSYTLYRIYQMIFRLPFLKYSSVILSEGYESNASVLRPINERCNTIKHLFMNHSCTLNELIAVVSCTPQLSYLTCQTLIEFNNNIKSEVSITLPDLTHIYIVNCYVEFNELEMFMKKICSQLKVLRISEYYNTYYIDPDRWKQLILHNMSQLRRFDLKCRVDLNDNFKDYRVHSFIDRFLSEFWIEHGWMLGLEVKHKKIFYSINSNRKTWFSFNENVKVATDTDRSICCSREEANNSSIQFTTPTELCIKDYFIIDWSPQSFEKLSPILIAVQFTSLCACWSNFSVGTLIKIIGLLPNLNSLKISRLSLEQLKNYSKKETENLRLVSISNKITKVWQLSDFESTRFLISLCPRMEYLEVKFIVYKDLEKLIRFILMETATHPHSLCFHVRCANDQMIYDLQKIIDSGKLIFNYSITRKCNDILLQWKLQ